MWRVRRLRKSAALQCIGCQGGGWHVGRLIALLGPRTLEGPLSSLMEGWLGHQMSPRETSPTGRAQDCPTMLVRFVLKGFQPPLGAFYAPFLGLLASNKGRHSKIALILYTHPPCRSLELISQCILWDWITATPGPGGICIGIGKYIAYMYICF